MGSAKGYEKVVMHVICEDGELDTVKERLEQAGIIYAEGQKKISFAVIPEQHKEDLRRAKRVLFASSH